MFNECDKTIFCMLSLQDIEAMKQRLAEMEKEAAKLKEAQVRPWVGGMLVSGGHCLSRLGDTTR